MMILFSGLVTLHALVRESLSPVLQLQNKINQMAHEKAQAEFRAELAASTLAEYQQHVATLIPGAARVPAAAKGAPHETELQNYPLRQLASVVGLDRGEKLIIERATGHMEKGKAAFRAGLFDEASVAFTEVIEKFPDSIHLAEAHFLLVESQFQIKNYEAAIETVEHMVEIFPESEMTGYSLLRLGKIYEIQDRLEDAADIYRAVIGNFKEEKLREQAQRLLKAVAL
jgi:TolA-binding protein